jgi:hypothetical protein
MTAVEWLIDQICGEHTDAWKEEIKQALEMEKKQIKESYEAGYQDGDAILGYQYFDNSESYYKKTYKSE